jgi:DNA polymerase-3 subunit epsilon
VVAALRRRLADLAGAGRYEDAARVRERLAALLRACIRRQRLVGLTGIAEVCAARPAGGGWELAVVRHGRLAGAGLAARGTHPRAVLETVLATAETVVGGTGPTPCASAEETDRVLRWLERPETRLVSVSSGWAAPLRGAARFTGLLAQLDRASRPG